MDLYKPSDVEEMNITPTRTRLIQNQIWQMPVLRVEVRVNEYCNTHRQKLYAYIIDLALFYFDLQVRRSKRLMGLQVFLNQMLRSRDTQLT
jgi:hypothetical protein